MTAKPILETPHAYDNPWLTPLQFLLAVMHDRNAALFHRIQAASYALPLTSPPMANTRVHPDLVIRVPTLDGEPEPPPLQ